MNARDVLEGTGVAIPNVGDVVADKYRIDARLGQGGMGAVLAATHLVTGKQVALKWLLPRRGQSADDVERLVREAQAAGRIHHPGVVDIYDVGEHAGLLFLVMEYLEGQPLRAHLQQGALQPGPLLAVLLPAMRGVQAAHARGVVHRDLKPENVFICSGADGEALHAKVLDFGVSKLQPRPELGEATLTESGIVLGTPHYMAPEQAEDSKAVDHRVDVYAFGVLLYEALSGAKPFQAETLTALLLQIARGEALPLASRCPALPAGLARAVTKAMARDASDRFADMSALIAVLEAFAGGPSASLPAVSGQVATVAAATPTPPRGRSRAARAALALLLAVGVLAFGLVALRQQSPRVPPAPAEEPAAHAPSRATTTTTPIPGVTTPTQPPAAQAASEREAPTTAPAAPPTVGPTKHARVKDTRTGSEDQPASESTTVPATARALASDAGATSPAADQQRRGRTAIRLDRNQF